MYTVENGPTDAPTILFIHGAGVAGWMWKGQVEALSPDYHCLVLDLPRHGKTGGTAALTMASTADQLADLIRAKAHGGMAHVVGLSLGGSLTVELLARYPDLLHSAIISAPAFGPFPKYLLVLSRLMAPLSSIEFLIRQNAKVLQIPPEDYADFRQSQKMMTPDVLMEVLRAIDGYRLNPALRQVNVPTLTVVGEKEMDINKRAARLIAETMPNATHRIAPGCHHAWNAERPDLFNAMIQAWVSGGLLPAELLSLEHKTQKA